MADLPEGYRDISDEDKKKANVFFERGRTVADTGNYEYAIEMYLQGLQIDPDSIDAHQAVREISMRRKATGGKPMGMTERWGLKKGDDKQNMLNAEKLLGYDPGNADHMVSMMTAAQKAGCYDTVLWSAHLLFQAMMNLDEKKRDIGKLQKLKEVYTAINEPHKALDALAIIMRMRPGDMNLSQELKDLGARATMKAGNYEAGDFRKSIKNMAFQKELMDKDMDVRSLDALGKAVYDAEQAHQADPADPAKFSKLIDSLRRTEQMDSENRAIELLEQKYQDTKQFKFRQAVGQIKISQLGRMERSMREDVQKNPTDADVRKQYQVFLRERAAEEMRIWKEIAENYPTDPTAKFEVGKRMFALGQHGDAIPILQQVRSDPKFKIQAGIYLGRSFLEAGFAEEAAETLHGVISDYPARDERALELLYYYGRALEEKGDRPAAVKVYSQVAQMNFNYKDVQSRLKRLRTPPPTT